MISTQLTLQVAAERRRDLERRAAEQRLARHLRTTNSRNGRLHISVRALKRLGAALVPHRRPAVCPQAFVAPNTRCCAA